MATCSDLVVSRQTLPDVLGCSVEAQPQQRVKSMYEITAEDASTLLYLSSLWEGVFRVSFSDGIWSAQSVETGEVLTAISATGLRHEMREYCWRWRS